MSYMSDLDVQMQELSYKAEVLNECLGLAMDALAKTQHYSTMDEINERLKILGPEFVPDDEKEQG